MQRRAVQPRTRARVRRGSRGRCSREAQHAVGAGSEVELAGSACGAGGAQRGRAVVRRAQGIQSHYREEGDRGRPRWSVHWWLL